MEAGAAGGVQQPPKRVPGIGEDAPEGLVRAAQGEDLNGAEERSALSYLLGATKRPSARVPIDFWTEQGMVQMYVVLKAVDGRRLEQIDAENRRGDGPFAKLDKTGFNVGVLMEAIERFENTDGSAQVKLTDEEFVGGIPGGPAIALETRFKYQPGLLDSLVEKVNELSAFTQDRVGGAQRVLVDAAGNS
jgi:hypothetical protein